MTRTQLSGPSLLRAGRSRDTSTDSFASKTAWADVNRADHLDQAAGPSSPCQAYVPIGMSAVTGGMSAVTGGMSAVTGGMSAVTGTRSSSGRASVAQTALAQTVPQTPSPHPLPASVLRQGASRPGAVHEATQLDVGGQADAQGSIAGPEPATAGDVPAGSRNSTSETDLDPMDSDSGDVRLALHRAGRPSKESAK
jgi:hypothetical protein